MKKQINIKLMCIAFLSAGRICGISLVITTMFVLLEGCSSENSRVPDYVSTNSVTTETIAAGDFLRTLHEENRLAGDSKDDRGEIKTDTLPLSDFKDVTYPFSRTFHVVKTGSSYTNNYTVVRKSKGSEWELQRAWRTDSNGQKIEEWPVRSN
jgi:hypothetical protein